MWKKSLFFLLLLVFMGVTVSESRAEVLPYFRYCNVVSNNTSSGVTTLIRAEVYHPAGLIPSDIRTIKVVGPNGFTASMSTSDYDVASNVYLKNIPKTPPAGEYAFTMIDSGNASITSYYYLSKVVFLPMVFSSSLLASGNPLTPLLSWSSLSGYQGNAVFKVTIYDAAHAAVWVSAVTGTTAVQVPPGVLSSGVSYLWSVTALDNDQLAVTDNQSESSAVPLSIDGTHPQFLAASLYSINSPTLGTVFTGFSASFPGGASHPTAVTGPGGFSRTVGSPIVSGIPVDGIYTFTASDDGGITKTVDYHYFKYTAVPQVDETTLRASGDPSAPLLTWCAPNGAGPIYYNVNVWDSGDGGLVWSSAASNTGVLMPAGKLVSGHSYVWQVEVSDLPSPYGPNNVNDTNKISLVVDNSSPNFQWGATTHVRHDTDGTYTGLDVYVNDPGGTGLDPSTMVLSVAGPAGSGFNYDFQPEDYVANLNGEYEYYHKIPRVLPDGIYTYTLTYTGGQLVTYDALKNGSEIPFPDPRTFQVSGDDMLAPTISWSGVSGYAGHLYYGLRILDSAGATVYASSGAPYTSHTVPSRLLQSGQSYEYRIEAYEDPSWIVFNNRSTSYQLALVAGHMAAPRAAAGLGASVPDAPTGVTATAGNTQATVSFTAPASDGGSAITSYTVTSIPGSYTATGTGSPITVTGLTNGTAYVFRVTADNAIGSSIASAASSPVTPATVPGAPTGVTATGGNAQATVSFTAPSSTGGSPITSYTVTSNPGSKTATGTGSPITVTGLTNGTAYTFTVTAANAIGSGGASSASSAVTPVTVPDAPTGATATDGNAQAAVSFTAPASDGGSAITSYTVRSSPGSKTATGTGSPMTVTGLTNGTAYTFTVTATNAIGTSSASAPSSPVTPVALPGAPTGLKAKAGNTQATVSFLPPASNGGSAITSYTVTSSPGGITASGALSPLTVSGLTNGTAYTFTVTATNAVGSGPASAASNSVLPVTVPGAPTGVTGVPGNGQVAVSFSAPLSDGGSPINYYIVASNPGGKKATGTSSPITVSGLNNGIGYTFKVTARSAVGCSLASDPSSKVIPASVPGKPGRPSGKPGNGQAIVSFSPPAGNGSSITSYTVTVSPGGATVSGAKSPITVTGLTNGTSYTFTVNAINAIGTGATSAASVAVVPSTVSDAPTGVTGAAGSSQVQVSFSAPAFNGGSAIILYTVTASPGGKTVTGKSSPLTLKGLTNGTAYTFTVKGYNKNGWGPQSSASAAVTPATVPGAPTAVTATAGTAAATVTFTAPTANGGSAITSYTVTSIPGGITASGTSSPLTVTGLTSGTVYSFGVRAVNSVGPGLTGKSGSVTVK